jgi:hypothetical protein
MAATKRAQARIFFTKKQNKVRHLMRECLPDARLHMSSKAYEQLLIDFTKAETFYGVAMALLDEMPRGWGKPVSMLDRFAYHRVKATERALKDAGLLG